jgi:hypothetical protein
VSPVSLFWETVTHKIYEISSLSFSDFVCIVGNYNHILEGSKPEVDPTLKARGYSDAAIEAARKSVIVSPTVSQGLRFTRHLSRYKYPLMSYVLTLLENYERGQLPFPGSVSEQPAQIMEIFALLQSLKHERDQRLNEKIERENGRRKSTDTNRVGRQGR